MEYNIIVSLFVFLFLACNPDFNTTQKDMKYQSSKKGLKSNKKGLTPKTDTNPNQEEDINNQEENTLLEDFKKFNRQLDGTSKQSANNERFKAYRKRAYSILNAIYNNALKNFSEIVNDIRLNTRNI
ncbi:hypothetical protein LRB67_04910 [Borreliella bissettiae]|uniref:hypothetical protein n=1 Tax=Borrelia bissettiae TaxID=64897 RepID=UPI001E2C5B9D|nr:hypothetical protein [Borreliella bissettiae]MCD2401599.1 hypothetical protein [Borreliella bissettiae]